MNLPTFSALLILVMTAMACTENSPKEQAPVPLAPETPKVVEGNNQFALDLYGKLRSEKGNLFYSPYSLSTALAMTYAGARTQTAEQMAKTLHFNLEPDKLHAAMGALYKNLNAGGQKRGYRLNVANALWGQKNFGFLPDFLNVTKTHYAAGFNEVDFAGASEAARKTINDWVEKETQQKIKELIKPGVLGTLTRLVLTNAIYFKGDWASKFKKEATREEPFHLRSDKQVKVLMMNQTGKFRYLEDETFQALELPYVGKDLAMLVFLPKKIGSLSEFEKTLIAAKLKEWLAKLQSQEVIVSLPKFKMTAEFSLAPVLSAMGMPLAFDSRKADFSGMSGSTERLFVSAVVHKAFVEVNEEGTEAAAATGVVVTTRSERVLRRFRADHPFIFLIRDNRTGSILFVGRVSNPQS